MVLTQGEQTLHGRQVLWAENGVKVLESTSKVGLAEMISIEYAKCRRGSCPCWKLRGLDKTSSESVDDPDKVRPCGEKDM